ncbi:ATP-binding protein [Streptomyces sp. SID3343]|uniref:ATP-binding protein n=1 Tax=Streptomyces sp. SID3343 TaxID=2690260 RepID=UPI001F2CCE78|nr:ATP-binding protein [Streptomyces sp. SID3343]
MRSQAPGDGGACFSNPSLRQVRRLPFEGASGAVARSRTFIRNTLHSYGWSGSDDEQVVVLSDDVLLVAVELVTNACLHAGGPVELRVVRTPELIRIEVDDRSEEAPQARAPHSGTRPGGHGLHIIRRLTLDWGTVVHRGAGKTVWVDMPVPEHMR